jgi:hypothetical protein
MKPPRTYVAPEPFKQALEQRLKSSSMSGAERHSSLPSWAGRTSRTARPRGCDRSGGPCRHAPPTSVARTDLVGACAVQGEQTCTGFCEVPAVASARAVAEDAAEANGSTAARQKWGTLRRGPRLLSRGESCSTHDRTAPPDRQPRDSWHPD